VNNCGKVQNRPTPKWSWTADSRLPGSKYLKSVQNIVPAFLFDFKSQTSIYCFLSLFSGGGGGGEFSENSGGPPLRWGGFLKKTLPSLFVGKLFNI